MKNKLYLPVISGLCSLLVASCINDIGNYEYEDAHKIFPVTISGLPRDTTVRMNTAFKIVPNVQGTESGDYSYNWNIMRSVTDGVAPQKTILSQERILDITLPPVLDAGRYFLNLEVRDINRNVYVRQQINLTLTASDMSTGWYILKDIDNETDFDYISSNGSVRVADVLLHRATPSRRLPGTAVQMIYQSGGYYHTITDTDGSVITLNGQQVFHILSSGDINTFKASNMERYKTFEDQFYGPLFPSVRPQSILFASGMGDLFLVNDGSIHSINGMSANIGKYPAAKIGIYSMHRDMISPTFSNALLFDLLSNTFYSTTASGNTINRLAEESANASNPIGISPSNMDYTLLNLLPRNDAMLSISAYAVMKRITDDTYHLFGVNFSYTGSTAYPFTSYNPIIPSAKMPLAQVKAAPNSGNFIYFADDNKLCVYKNYVPMGEEVLKEYPEGETIAYIQHLIVYGLNSPSGWLVVLTNSAAGWKLYAHSVIGLGNPEFNTDPVVTESGTGNARSFMYRE